MSEDIRLLTQDGKPLVLEPGKTYVLKLKDWNQDFAVRQLLDFLHEVAPESNFVVLPPHVDLVCEDRRR
jgi:hypothetical protein